MKEPKVVLKNVKTFQGHDGTGLNASVWINGINCMHLHDAANGGEFDYTENLFNNPNAEQVKKNIALLKEYVKQLPEKEVKCSDRTVKIKIDLDLYLDEILEKQEQAKVDKKFEKEKQLLMQTAIVLGKPDEKEFSYISFEQPLSDIPMYKLQTQLNQIVLTHCKKGIQVLNTNLEELGLEVRY